MLPLLSSATVVNTFGQMLAVATSLTANALIGEKNRFCGTVKIAEKNHIVPTVIS